MTRKDLKKLKVILKIAYLIQIVIVFLLSHEINTIYFNKLYLFIFSKSNKIGETYIYFLTNPHLCSKQIIFHLKMSRQNFLSAEV